MAASQSYDRQWHLSKTVSIGTALGLLVNVAVMIYLFGQQNAQFQGAIDNNAAVGHENANGIKDGRRNLEVVRDSLRSEIHMIQRETSAQAVAIGRIEVGISNIQETLKKQGK